MLFILGIMLILSILNIILFYGNPVMSVLMILCVAVMIVLKLFAAKKLKKTAVLIVYAGCVIVFFICALFGRRKISEYGLMEYAERMERAEAYMEDGEYKEAVKMLETIETELGQTNAVSLLKAEAYLEDGQLDEAVRTLWSVDDKNSADYYLHLAACYDRKGDLNMLKKTLIDGADRNPENLTLNFKAGCLAAEAGEYVTANYYLMRAMVLCPATNAYVPYAVAGIRYDVGNEEEAFVYMQIAEENGITGDKELEKDPVMQWYLSKKQEGGNE